MPTLESLPPACPNFLGLRLFTHGAQCPFSRMLCILCEVCLCVTNI